MRKSASLTIDNLQDAPWVPTDGGVSWMRIHTIDTSNRNTGWTVQDADTLTVVKDNEEILRTLTARQ